MSINHPSSKITIDIFPFVKVKVKETPPFCVDGRAGKVNKKTIGPYPQLLGGSLMPSVLEWLIKRTNDDLAIVLPDVFQELKKQGYPLGAHTSTHAVDGKSDCGFADNLGNILTTFKNRFDEIKGIIGQAGVTFGDGTWQEIGERLNQIKLDNLPTGEQLIGQAENLGAVKQVLDGEHQEVAAIVNLVPNTTLDTDNNQGHQAFNLDLWLIKEMAEKFNWDLDLVKALSLGLYLATEMVLVEGKRKPRLLILVRRNDAG